MVICVKTSERGTNDIEQAKDCVAIGNTRRPGGLRNARVKVPAQKDVARLRDSLHRSEATGRDQNIPAS